MSGASSNSITEDLIQKVQNGSEQMTEGKAIALAGELFSRKRYGQAANVCRQVLRHNAKNPDAHNILGVCLDAMGKTKEGVAAIKRAITLAPGASNYRANLGEVLRSHGDLANSLIELIEAVRLARHYQSTCDLPKQTTTWVIRCVWFQILQERNKPTKRLSLSAKSIQKHTIILARFCASKARMNRQSMR
jgi:Tfp pilus assembly protein PilF